MKYILLHGMGQNASSWDKTISFLPDNTEAVCPELSDFFTEGTVIIMNCMVLSVKIGRAHV